MRAARGAGVGELSGFNANFAQGMDFDNATGTLYGCIYTGGGSNVYGTWDTTTGEVTPLNVDEPLGEWECAIPNPCPDLELTLSKSASPTTARSRRPPWAPPGPPGPFEAQRREVRR